MLSLRLSDICISRLAVASVALALFAAAPAICAANELIVELDPVKTHVAFTVADTLHTVHGTFRLAQGHFSFNPVTSAMSGEIVVDARSGNSGSRARDGRMTRDILQAKRFPEIRFTPTSKLGEVAPSGVSNINVTGSFLIHGQAHDMTLPMQVTVSGDEIAAKATFVVPYVQWGMKNPSNFLFKVNDKVEIDLTAVGRSKLVDTVPR